MSNQVKDPIPYLMAILLPPVAILAKPGIDGATIGTNILLTVLGWIPGILHAWTILAQRSYTVYSTKSVSSGSDSIPRRSSKTTANSIEYMYEPRHSLKSTVDHIEHEPRRHRKSHHGSHHGSVYGSHRSEERRGSAAGSYVLTDNFGDTYYQRA